MASVSACVEACTGFLSPPSPRPSKLLSQLHFLSTSIRPRLVRPSLHRLLPSSSPCAASSGVVGAPGAPGFVVQAEENTMPVDLLACPICFEPLHRDGKAGYNQAAILASRFMCQNCKKVYASNNTYLDLTITFGAESYEETMQPSTELFRNPVVSFVYERGWRQAFQAAGYPGPDEEMKMAQKYLVPAVGGVLLDVSCASGIFTRRFVKSGLYSSVIAVDFSESMLGQFQSFIEQDPFLKKSNLALVRADVARLPFATGTIDAVHAGAALHCWPSPSKGVAEISRILKPGGVFVATTNVIDVIKPIKQALKQTYGGPGIWSEKELEGLCKSCGLVNWSKIRRLAFIMFSAQKPL